MFKECAHKCNLSVSQISERKVHIKISQFKLLSNQVTERNRKVTPPIATLAKKVESNTPNVFPLRDMQ